MKKNYLERAFLWVDPCLLKVVWLIEVSSNFMQEKPTIFIFSLYLGLLVRVNKWSSKWFFWENSRYVCVNAMYALKHVPLHIRVWRHWPKLSFNFTCEPVYYLLHWSTFSYLPDWITKQLLTYLLLITSYQYS